MKFCFILTQDLESPSGLGRYYPWGKELNKLGHQVDIIALHGDFTGLLEKTHYFSKDFSVRYVSQMHVQKKGNTKKYFQLIKLLWIVFIATIRLMYFSLITNADIYIVGKPHPMNGIAGIICKIISRKKLIVDCDDDEANSGNFKGNWQKLAIQFFEINIPKIADLVTTNTTYSMQRLINSGINEDKIYFLSNGVDPERFRNFDEQKLEKLRKDLGLLNKKVIAYIGSLSLSNHAVDLLIDSFELIIEENKNFRLLLVGGGEDFEKLQDYVRNEKLTSFIIFTGRINPNDVKYYYKLADISVDPIYDNIAAKARSPLKIFESWICGTPIVTLDVGDRKYLRSLSNLINTSDNFSTKAFADKLIIVSKNNNKNYTYQLNIEKYYWKNLVKGFVNILE